ncbi:MAG: SOS response-associated peptidase family protein, partial [Acidimicrobiia bacterium]|nr:SOS response-associated peptidase family protein [Acidimicrobiia bacterium]
MAKGKLPHYITMKSGAPLAAAGIWSSWRDRDTEQRVLTCAILTGTPNQLLEPIHDRMPCILPEDAWTPWLDRSNDDVDALRSLLTVYPASEMSETPVSTLVNNVRNDAPELIAPLKTPVVDRP